MVRLKRFKIEASSGNKMWTIFSTEYTNFDTGSELESCMLRVLIKFSTPSFFSFFLHFFCKCKSYAFCSFYFPCAHGFEVLSISSSISFFLYFLYTLSHILLTLLSVPPWLYIAVLYPSAVVLNVGSTAEIFGGPPYSFLSLLVALIL